MLPDISAVHDILTEISVDDATVKAIVGILEENAQAIQGGHPASLNATYLGGSDAGALLGHHTSLAHQKVVEAMQQMVAGLNGYRDNIEHFHKNITFADETSSQTTITGAGRVDAVPSVPQASACTTSTTVHDNPSCTLPTGGDS